jgi:hypothetical protein
MCCNALAGVDVDAVAVPAATRAVVAHYFGRRGVFANQAFAYLNATYFDGTLPWPLVLWGLTPHGACLGATRVHGAAPIITLHPALLGGNEPATPWGIEARWLGPAFVCDVLLHECLHLAVHTHYGGATGSTSHNSPEWVAEVNRLAPLLGFPEFVAGRSVARRVAVPDADPADGRRRTVVQRQSDTVFRDRTLGFRVVAGFPYALRLALGQTDRYERTTLAFAHALDERSQ